jgi:hypothetical protein
MLRPLLSCFRLGLRIEAYGPDLYGSRYTITSVSCPSLTCVWAPPYHLFKHEVLVPLRNVRGPGAGFVPILLYTLVIGNLTMLIMNLLAPVSSRLHFPFDWVACLIFLFLAAVASVSLTVAIMMTVHRVPLDAFFAQLWGSGKLVFIVILIVGTVRHLYKQTRLRLERKNLELQRGNSKIKS